MTQATNISMPSPERVREIIREVQDATVDGAVFARRGKGDYETISPEIVKGKQLSIQGIEITGAGYWLLYRLLHVYQPSMAPHRTENLAALNVSAGSATLHRLYDGVRHGRAVAPDMQEKVAEVFAQGNEDLYRELKTALAVTPVCSIQEMKTDYSRIPRKSRTEVLQIRNDYRTALAAQMELAGMGNAELSEQLALRGLVFHGQTISHFKRGVNLPNSDMAQAIIAVLSDAHAHAGRPLPEDFDRFRQLSRDVVEFKLIGGNKGLAR